MTQHYLLPCACGQLHRVSPAQAGGQVDCQCGQRLTIPTLRGLRDLKPAPESAPAKTAPGWSRVHGAIFAVSLVAAAAGLVVAGAFLFLYVLASRDTVDQTDVVIRNAESERPIDTMTPLAALEEWKSEVLPGLHIQVIPHWIIARRAAEFHLFWVKVGAGLLAAGAIGAVAALFIGRGRKQLAL